MNTKPTHIIHRQNLWMVAGGIVLFASGFVLSLGEMILRGEITLSGVELAISSGLFLGFAVLVLIRGGVTFCDDYIFVGSFIHWKKYSYADIQRFEMVEVASFRSEEVSAGMILVKDDKPVTIIWLDSILKSNKNKIRSSTLDIVNRANEELERRRLALTKN